MGTVTRDSKRSEGSDSSRAAKVRYLTYNLSRLPFACALDRIQEVMGLQPIFALPDAPSFVSGAIRVHQKLIPVIDLRRMLGLPARVSNRRNCILLLRVGEGLQLTQVGAIVDSVSEVVDIHPHEVRETSQAASGARTGLVTGTMRIRGRLTRLLNVDVLLTSEERTTITSIAA
jgi:purine-binding chemotaxis protein CheW